MKRRERVAEDLLTDRYERIAAWMRCCGDCEHEKRGRELFPPKWERGHYHGEGGWEFAMRKILVALVGIMLFATSAMAASNVTFQWDANTEADLAGYKLWQGPAATGPWTLKATVGKVTTTTLNGVPDGQTFFTLTAHDIANNQSGYSNVVPYNADTTPPGAPKNFTVTVTVTVTVPVP